MGREVNYGKRWEQQNYELNMGTRSELWEEK